MQTILLSIVKGFSFKINFMSLIFNLFMVGLDFTKNYDGKNSLTIFGKKIYDNKDKCN